MKKTSTVRVNGNMIFKGHKLTIGLDLGDRWSNYCVLDEAGEVLLEQKLPTTPEAMKQTFERIPRSLMALETGTHSPWVSRLLRELGHEVLVAHAQKVELISKSKRKDDRRHWHGWQESTLSCWGRDGILAPHSPGRFVHSPNSLVPRSPSDEFLPSRYDAVTAPTAHGRFFAAL